MITSIQLLISYVAYCNTTYHMVTYGMRYLSIKAFISRDQDKGLYTGGFLGEMIQWTDILTALDSFKSIVMDFE